MHQKIITQIEKIRRNNNKNWMNLLRIALPKDPVPPVISKVFPLNIDDPFIDLRFSKSYY